MPTPQYSSLSEHLDIELLSSAIKSTLQATIFSSGLRISPRRTGEISQSLAQAFFDYYEEQEPGAVNAHGGRLAAEGLSSQSLLAATEAVRTVCAKASNPLDDLPSIAGAFTTALCLGFIEGRERRIIEQQERTHQALMRAQERERE